MVASTRFRCTSRRQKSSRVASRVNVNDPSRRIERLNVSSNLIGRSCITISATLSHGIHRRILGKSYLDASDGSRSLFVTVHTLVLKHTSIAQCKLKEHTDGITSSSIRYLRTAMIHRGMAGEWTRSLRRDVGRGAAWNSVKQKTQRH